VPSNLEKKTWNSVGTSLYGPFVLLVCLLLPWCRKTVIRNIH